MSFTENYLTEAVQLIQQLDTAAIERAVALLAQTRLRKGQAMHYQQSLNRELKEPADRVWDSTKSRIKNAGEPLVEYLLFSGEARLTAPIHGTSGFAEQFAQLKKEDTILVFSVGGGNLEKQVSPNIVAALKYAKQVGTTIVGVVGRDGGYTAKVADACVLIPNVNAAHVTPHTEAFQAVVWHLMVSHPELKAAETKWESVR